MDENRSAREEAAAEDESVRAWRPSRPAGHRAEAPSRPAEGQVVMRREEIGLLRAFLRRLNTPIARILVGLALFIAAAIVFDATINGGSWTEREPPPKRYRP